MEVILLENIRRLGKIGETVKVKDGFGRNFLLPRAKALRANEANKKVFEERRAVIEKENAERLKEAQKVAKKLEGLIVPVLRQASEDGRLFGSVTTIDIARGIKEEKGVEIHRNAVVLTNPVKAIGIVPVTLSLHSDLQLEIQLNVARTEDEAAAAKAAFLKGEYTGPTKKNSDEEDAAPAQSAAAPAAEDEQAA